MSLERHHRFWWAKEREREAVSVRLHRVVHPAQHGGEAEDLQQAADWGQWRQSGPAGPQQDHRELRPSQLLQRPERDQPGDCRELHLRQGGEDPGAHGARHGRDQCDQQVLEIYILFTIHRDTGANNK